MHEGQSAGFWLSPQQKFAWNLEPGLRPACVISLTGPADGNRVFAALRQIASRHEILRTVFHRQTGMKVPFQVVLKNLEPGWECVDVSPLPAPDRDHAFQTLWDKHTVCELGSELGLALKAILVNMGEGNSKLLVSLNPLCGDAQSLSVIARELPALYASPNPELSEPFRYVQFAQWQGDLLESTDEDAQKAKNFWAKQAELFPSLALPGEGAKDEMCGFAPGMVRVTISKDLASGIARDKPAEFLFAAWQVAQERRAIAGPVSRPIRVPDFLAALGVEAQQHSLAVLVVDENHLVVHDDRRTAGARRLAQLRTQHVSVRQHVAGVVAPAVDGAAREQRAGVAGSRADGGNAREIGHGHRGR